MQYPHQLMGQAEPLAGLNRLGNTYYSVWKDKYGTWQLLSAAVGWYRIYMLRAVALLDIWPFLFLMSADYTPGSR